MCKGAAKPARPRTLLSYANTKCSRHNSDFHYMTAERRAQSAAREGSEMGIATTGEKKEEGGLRRKRLQPLGCSYIAAKPHSDRI